MLRWLESENGEKGESLDQRKTILDKINRIGNSTEKLEKLKTIARSRTMGIWRIKRAKIILGTLAGKTVEKMVLAVRVPPESILECQVLFAEDGFNYFKNPKRGPTQREALVEQLLAFLENPPPKRSEQWGIVSVRYIGHDFSAQKTQHIRDLISNRPELSIAEISRQVCVLFDLYQPNGKIRLSQTTSILKRMDMDNVIALPVPQKKPVSLKKRKPNKQKKPLAHTFPNAGKTIKLNTSDIRHLQFIPVYSKKDSILWREIIEAFHYIKVSRLFGAQLRYLVYGDKTLPGTIDILRSNNCSDPDRHWAKYYGNVERGRHLVAALGFASPAWRLSSRDSFIGWSDKQREANLRLVANNVRFLILPWIKSKYLASRILGGIAKQMPIDWEARYNYRPVLLETFVQLDRFKGTCYRAANWMQIGKTEGYSLVSHYKKQASTKGVFVYPLCNHFRKKLCCLP